MASFVKRSTNSENTGNLHNHDHNTHTHDHSHASNGWFGCLSVHDHADENVDHGHTHEVLDHPGEAVV